MGKGSVVHTTVPYFYSPNPLLLECDPAVLYSSLRPMPSSTIQRGVNAKNTRLGRGEGEGRLSDLDIGIGVGGGLHSILGHVRRTYYIDLALLPVERGFIVNMDRISIPPHHKRG